MPKELDPIEEFDILTELQFPDYIYSIDSIDEQIAFSKYINSLPDRRILLLHNELLTAPFVVAGLTENHIETIIKDGSYNSKFVIFIALADEEFMNDVLSFSNELDYRNKTTENSTRLTSIVQYLKDNANII